MNDKKPVMVISSRLDSTPKTRLVALESRIREYRVPPNATLYVCAEDREAEWFLAAVESMEEAHHNHIRELERTIRIKENLVNQTQKLFDRILAENSAFRSMPFWERLKFAIRGKVK